MSIDKFELRHTRDGGDYTQAVCEVIITWLANSTKTIPAKCERNSQKKINKI